MRKFILYILLIIGVCSANSCSTNSKKGTTTESTHTVMPTTELSQITKDIKGFFNTPEQFREGVKSYQDGDKFGFINEQDEIVIPAAYESVGCFNEGLVSVTLNGKMGYINHSGKLVIPAIYDFTNYFSQGVAWVCKDGKFGYINKNGEIVIDFIYDKADVFWEADGFAAVKLNEKYGLIDIKGNIVMPISFEFASSTMDGVATILDGNKEISVYNDKSYKVTTY